MTTIAGPDDRAATSAEWHVAQLNVGIAVGSLDEAPLPEFMESLRSFTSTSAHKSR